MYLCDAWSSMFISTFSIIIIYLSLFISIFSSFISLCLLLFCRIMPYVGCFFFCWDFGYSFVFFFLCFVLYIIICFLIRLFLFVSFILNLYLYVSYCIYIYYFFNNAKVNILYVQTDRISCIKFHWRRETGKVLVLTWLRKALLQACLLPCYEQKCTEVYGEMPPPNVTVWVFGWVVFGVSRFAEGVSTFTM